MKTRMFLVVLVCCLVIFLMGCGYTAVKYSSANDAEQEDEVSMTLSKEEVVGTTEVPLDLCQNLFGNNDQTPGNLASGIFTLEGRDDKVGVFYTIALPDGADVKSAKINFKAKGEGLSFVLNFEQSKGADQQKTSFYFVGNEFAEREFVLSPLAQYLQVNTKGDNVFELCMEVEKGKKLEISQIKVDFLSFEPEVKTIVHHDEQPPVPEVVRYCHRGPIWVYNPYSGYYEVYYDWWTGSRYVVWRDSYYRSYVSYWPTQRVYYYHYYFYPSTVNVHCDPAPRVQCAQSSRVDRPRPAVLRASNSAAKSNRALAVNEGAQSVTSKKVADVRRDFKKSVQQRNTQTKAAPARSQSRSGDTSWINKIVNKGKERLAPSSVKRQSSSSDRTVLKRTAESAASRIKETQQVQPQQIQKGTSSNDDDEKKNEPAPTTSSSQRVRRQSR